MIDVALKIGEVIIVGFADGAIAGSEKTEVCSEAAFYENIRAGIEKTGEAVEVHLTQMSNVSYYYATWWLKKQLVGECTAAADNAAGMLHWRAPFTKGIIP